MLNGTLQSRIDLNDELCILRIKPDAGVPTFEPGQFIRLGLYERTEPTPPPTSSPSGAVVASPTGEKLVKRAYSIASSSADHEALEFYVVKVRDGRLTPEVWELGLGGRLWVDAKIQGEFTLHNAPASSRMLMLATGTGIAPYVSMLRTYAGTQRWQSCTVVHGVRHIHDLGYREELEAIARRYFDIRYVPIISREPEEPWSGLRGRVLQVLEPEQSERLTGGPLVPGDAHVFLCGNPEMVQSARALLEPRGFVMSQRRHPGTMHTERYW